MERLTYMDRSCCQIRGADNRTCEEVCNAAEDGCLECPINGAFLKLKAYEDVGYSPEDFDKLCREMSDLRMALGLDTYEDLRKIIQAGRLLVLPCAIGTPVYVHEALCDVGGHATYMGCKYGQDCSRDRFIKCPLRVVKRAFTEKMRKGLGRTFWLTQKEAEDAIPRDRRG